MDGACCVLLVEGDSALRELYTRTLDSLSAQVEALADGVSGWEHFLRERPQVVVCDVYQPGLGGLEVIQRVHRAAPETEIILMTRCCTRHVVNAAQHFDAAAVLAKPFSLRLLRAQVERCLQRIQVQQRLVGLVRALGRPPEPNQDFADVARDPVTEVTSSHWLRNENSDYLQSVCIQCHRVRDAGGRWKPREQPALAQTGGVSHGVCPECLSANLQLLGTGG